MEKEDAMSRRLFPIALVGVLLLAAARPAAAQYGVPGVPTAPYGPRAPALNPSGRPALSPYLNLLRGGNQAANYYLGVVPEVERRVNTARFSAAISDLERRYAATAEAAPEEDLPVRGLAPTGHAVTFMNPYPYFGAGTTPRTGPGRPAAG